MDIEGKIQECEYNLKQINHFNPDPFYVNYFFEMYIQSIIDVYDKMFEEANRDFGLFVVGKCTKEKFEKKAIEKKDNLALVFLSWFNENYENEHESSYPKFIQVVINFFKEHNHLPKITIKIQASQKYKDDIVQLIQLGLTKGKLRSKEELEIEIKRQMPAFLEIINQKRKSRNEPKVFEHQIIASTYLEMKNNKEMEISYSCEIYLPVVKRIVDESRNEIKRLIKSTN